MAERVDVAAEYKATHDRRVADIVADIEKAEGGTSGGADYAVDEEAKESSVTGQLVTGTLTEETLSAFFLKDKNFLKFAKDNGASTYSEMKNLFMAINPQILKKDGKFDGNKIISGMDLNVADPNFDKNEYIKDQVLKGGTKEWLKKRYGIDVNSENASKIDWSIAKSKRGASLARY